MFEYVQLIHLTNKNRHLATSQIVITPNFKEPHFRGLYH